MKKTKKQKTAAGLKIHLLLTRTLNLPFQKKCLQTGQRGALRVLQLCTRSRPSQKIHLQEKSNVHMDAYLVRAQRLPDSRTPVLTNITAAGGNNASAGGHFHCGLILIWCSNECFGSRSVCVLTVMKKYATVSLADLNLMASGQQCSSEADEENTSGFDT